MKKIVLLLVISVLGMKAYAQESFSLADFKKNVGKKVTMCGMVSSYKLFSDTLTMLNMDGTYPNQRFTVVVTGREIVLNLDDIKGKQICVTGDSSMYLNKPEIMIYHNNQLEFKKP